MKRGRKIINDEIGRNGRGIFETTST